MNVEGLNPFANPPDKVGGQAGRRFVTWIAITRFWFFLARFAARLGYAWIWLLGCCLWVDSLPDDKGRNSLVGRQPATTNHFCCAHWHPAPGTRFAALWRVSTARKDHRIGPARACFCLFADIARVVWIAQLIEAIRPVPDFMVLDQFSIQTNDGRK